MNKKWCLILYVWYYKEKMLLFKLMTNIKISLKKIEKLNTKKKDSNNEIRKKRNLKVYNL